MSKTVEISFKILTPSKDFDISNTAASHLNEMIKANNSYGVRISLKDSGCSGFAYQLDLIDDAFAGCTFYTDISSTHHFRLNVWLGFENEKSLKCLDLSKLRTLILQSPLKLHIEILASEYGWSWNDIEFVLEKYIEKFGTSEGIHKFAETFKLIYILKSLEDVLRETGIELPELVTYDVKSQNENEWL